MPNYKLTLRLMAAIAVLVTSANALGQNLVNNFSMESPAFNSSYPPLVATGWFSSDPNNMFIDLAHATDGTQYQQLGASLEQNTGVAVVPGATYNLAFDWVSFTDGGPGSDGFAELYTNPNSNNNPLDAGNQLLFSQNLPRGPIAPTIHSLSYNITAPITATGFLHVRFLNGVNYRGLDNVRLTLVPEPSVLTLAFIPAIIGLLSLRRRKHA